MTATDNEEKKAVIEDLRADEAKVAPLFNKLAAFVVEENLDEAEVRHIITDEGDTSCFVRRCLIACNNDEKKAFKLAAKGLRWRSQAKPSKITLDDFPIAASQNLFSLGGHAKKNGWPFAVGYAVRWNPWKYSTAEYSRMIAFLMESLEGAIDKTNDPYARCYVIFDMKNMSKFNSDLRKVAELVKFASYYPERTVALVVNADLVTYALWHFISPLLDKRTRDRVTILRSEYKDTLEETFGLEQIGPILGGTRPEEWPLLSMEARANFKWGSDATGSPSPPPRHLATASTQNKDEQEETIDETETSEFETASTQVSVEA